MPHATLPPPGFQALILCGPGVSLNTFTSNPKEFPKALVPIANRPMVWYPLDWCYRMGVTDITLITPPESAPALETALAQNPHLTALPAPRPEIVAPEGLTQTTGTGEIFRFLEVQKVIKSDFILLPCDLICELDGSALLEAWMVLEAGLGSATGGIADSALAPVSLGGEKSGRRGGLGVWYPVKGLEGISMQGEETDFIATTALPPSVVPPPEGSPRSEIHKLVLSIPTDTVKDLTEEHSNQFPIRHSLLKKHGRIKVKTSHRDAHIYVFPFWVLEMMRKNEFDSVAEDVLGWWAKAGWQYGLGDKFGLREILQGKQKASETEDGMISSGQLEDNIDLASLSTTHTTTIARPVQHDPDAFASRVPNAAKPMFGQQAPLMIPPLLAYVQRSSAPPTSTDLKLIRRVDTRELLLSVSLRLAKLPPITETSSPFAHAAKIATPELLPQRSRVEATDCLLADNVAVSERVNIKECVIGAGCSIGAGSRLTRCLLMDGVTVGENVQLSGCIVGRRARIDGGGAKDEDKTKLTDCDVQGSFAVEWGTEAKNEKFMVFEGLSDEGSFEDVEGDEAGTTID
ncbi:Translation initiation factor eIF-2B subunit gamma [Elasticomyces elasticus]|nr:Translation initiation factor eIF-2B subunit gamma [Elasticomyces elasticus]